jgi:hypothetical protein
VGSVAWRVHTPHPPGEPSWNAGAGSSATKGARYVDRDKLGNREWRAFVNGEIDALWIAYRRLAEGREADRTEFERRLAAQHDALRAHTLAVTRGGWKFILGGVACSAYGTALALVA